MTLNNKIKNIRQKSGLTQEAFAEKINVSRQAVTKWETAKGIPDIENLKMISKVFHISLDELLNEQDELNDGKSIKAQHNNTNAINDDNLTDFVGSNCSIELKSWSDGAYDVTLLSKDKYFLYYISVSKKEVKIGAVAQKLIKSIEYSKSQKKFSIDCSKYYGIDESFFVGKIITLNLHEQHIWDGIIGKETEFSDVIVTSISCKELKILISKVVEQTIPKDEVAKLECKI